MKDFKFFTKEKNQPQLKVFSLNVMENPFIRIPFYTIEFEPFDPMYGGDSRGTISDLVTGRFGIPWRFSSMIIIRASGEQTTITYNDVNMMEDRHLIFHMDDYVKVRYRI